MSRGSLDTDVTSPGITCNRLLWTSNHNLVKSKMQTVRSLTPISIVTSVHKIDGGDLVYF